MTARIYPFDPDHVCPFCAAAGGEPVRHERPVLIVFGGGPQWPCAADAWRGGGPGEHLCARCQACGFAWMELPPGAPPALAYAGPGQQAGGDEMAIRKQGAATGKVTGVEQDGITREAARDGDWDGRDDEALAAENARADDSSRDDD